MQKLILMIMHYTDILDILSLKDLSEEDPIETEASKYDLSYIKLDGKIGCMVNGAGSCNGNNGHY